MLCLLFCISWLPKPAFSWEVLKTPHFYIHYQPLDQAIARRLAEQAGTIYTTITEDLAFHPGQPTALYLCPTPACFAHKQPASVRLPDWAVGVAYPALNRIVMRSALTPQEQGRIHPVEIFTHEFAHIVLEQALASHGGAPRWLSEGFSMYHARQWTISGQRILDDVVLRDRFIPLAILTKSFPSDEDAARIAYIQSFSLVNFLLNDERYGRPVFQTFISNLQQGMETNTALLNAAGVSVKRLEHEWQSALQQQTSWLRYLSQRGLFWFVLSLSVIILYVVKYFKMKRIHARWEHEEGTFDDEWTDEETRRHEPR